MTSETSTGWLTGLRTDAQAGFFVRRDIFYRDFPPVFTAFSAIFTKFQKNSPYDIDSADIVCMIDFSGGRERNQKHSTGDAMMETYYMIRTGSVVVGGMISRDQGSQWWGGKGWTPASDEGVEYIDREDAQSVIDSEGLSDAIIVECRE